MAKNRLLTFTGLGVYFFALSLCSIEAKAFSFGADVDNYIRLAANRYQVSEPMLRGLVKFENGWTGKISPTGATGVGQFTVGTWNWLAETEQGRKLGMRPVTKYNRGTSVDPRRNKYINTQATALLARWHIEQFSERSIPISDENLYMAHNIGLDGLHRALLGKSTRADIANMRKNGMKPWHTVNDFLRYQKSRYNEHKYAANFLQSEPKTNATTDNNIETKKKISLILPANLPTKIRYIEPSNELAMGKQNITTAKVNWIEPNSKNTVWIEPK